MLLGQIDPIAFQLGPIQVAWYGLIIGLAMLLAVFLTVKEAKRLGLDEDLIVDLAFYVIPAGIIGARLYYVLFELENYIQDPLSIFYIWEGGLAIYGGIIGGILIILWYCNKHDLDIWLLFDIVAPHLLLAQAIGRWGNFINQEAHGGEISREFLENLYIPEFIIEGMYINGAYYHPTFFYEFLVSIIGFIVLMGLRYKSKFLIRGEVFALYMIWYGTGRFFIEGLRTDSLYIGSLRVSQVLSAIIVLAGIATIIYRRFYLYPRPPYYSLGIHPEIEFNKKKQAYQNK